MAIDTIPKATKIAVHYGAGNIGRGFIGPLLVESGYHVIFADVQEPLINAINKCKEYEVQILDKKRRSSSVTNVSGVISTGADTIQALLRADIVTTSVGPNILPRIAGSIAEGISQRREYGKGPLNIIACENLIGATSNLKECVISKLENDEDDLAYLNEYVGFANCSVDRIVPPFKGSDPLQVGVEDFFEWVVDKNALKGDPDVQGMKLADNLDAYIERKLFTLNTGHAILAYLGSIKGLQTIGEAVADQELRAITKAAMEESGAALIKKHGFNPEEHAKYIGVILTRFENPNINDELVRVSRGPLRKLGENDRLVGPVLMTKRYGLPRSNLLKGVAAVFLHDNQADEESVELNKILKEGGIEEAIVQVTVFEKTDEEYQQILDAHNQLKTHMAPTTNGIH